MTTSVAELRLLIAKLPAKERQRVMRAEARIRAIIKEFGPAGRAALTVVGLELQEQHRFEPKRPDLTAQYSCAPCCGGKHDECALATCACRRRGHVDLI